MLKDSLTCAEATAVKHLAYAADLGLILQRFEQGDLFQHGR